MRTSLGAIALCVGLFACGGDAPFDAADGLEGKADIGAPERPIRTVDDLQGLFDRVRADVYPELADYSLELSPFDSEGDFFQASVKLTTAWKSGHNRVYLLKYNRALFGDPPSRAAVRAILVHEMKHILDYTKKSSVALAAFGIGYEFSNNRDYERATDEYALARGYGLGLKAYRLWLYDHVDAETEREKRATYYTPEEIDAYLRDH